MKKYFQRLSFLFIIFCQFINGDDIHFHNKRMKYFDNYIKNRTIILLGDDLTSGLCLIKFNSTSKASYYSYGNWIEKRLLVSSLNINETLNVNIIVSAKSEEETSSILFRFPEELDDISNIKFVLIWGGTYDLINNNDPYLILSNLINLHKLVHDRSTPDNIIYTVAITIPQINSKNANKLSRHIVNTGLLEFSRNNSNLVAFQDFSNLFDKANRANSIHWNHNKRVFSQKGYDEVGRQLYITITRHLYHQHFYKMGIIQRKRKLLLQSKNKNRRDSLKD